MLLAGKVLDKSNYGSNSDDNVIVILMIIPLDRVRNESSLKIFSVPCVAQSTLYGLVESI